MPRLSPDKPRISRWGIRLFSWYASWYLRRHVHALRVVRGSTPANLHGSPVIVCLNHPSWWDPLVALTLANRTFRGRSHYAPMDSYSLAKYRVFHRLGFFGIERNSVAGAARFLRVGKAILEESRSVLWITAQGVFTDARSRPVRLRSGIGHLVHSLNSVTIVPLALEYTFWEERSPEVLACWGEPIVISAEEDNSPSDWTQAIAVRLEEALDRLALLSQRRDKDAFDVVLSGISGVGGIYDLIRGVKSRVKRQPFVRQHGSEGF